MTHVYPMKSMELDDEDQIDMAVAMPDVARPRYPWGLRLCLTTKEIEKLGLEPEDAFVGGIVHLHALARITSVSSNEMERNGEPCQDHRVEMQIEDMCLESEDEENEEQDAMEDGRPRRMSPLYRR